MSNERETANVKEETPIFVEVIPGAAEHGLMKNVKDPVYGLSVKDFLDQLVQSEPENREERSLLDLVKKEYTKDSDITIRGKKVDVYSAKVKDFLEKRKTPKGKEYLYLPVNILKPEQGGYEN